MKRIKKNWIMGKIMNICLMMLCAGALAACSDDNDEKSGELKIVKADSNLPSVGGQASIQFAAPAGTVTAASDVDWCKVVEVTDTEVKLAAEPNTDYPGRSALITVTDGLTKQHVSVIQAGAVFVYDKREQWQVFTNKASQIEIELYGSFPCQVTIPATASWLSSKPSEDGKKQIFMAEENTTGSPRGCFVQVVSGDRTIEYEICQYEATDFLGSWKGQYSSVIDDKIYSLSNVTIDGPINGTFMIDGLIEGSKIPVKCIYSDGIYAIPGQYIGQVGAKDYLYFGLLNSETEFFWGTSQFIGLVPMLQKDGTFILSFTDIGGLQGSEAAGFLFAIFPTKSTAGEVKSFIEAYFDCLFYRDKESN